MFTASDANHLQPDCGSQLVCEPVIENLCFRSKERKSKNLTLKEKYDVIQMIVKDKKKVREVAVLFKCGKTQIYDIMKHKDKIIGKYMVGNEYDKSRRKEHHSKYQDIDDMVFKWYLEAKALNFPMSGPILKQKAKEAADLLKIIGFSASNGWLQSFRKRHSINFGVSGGKVREIHNDKVNFWNVKPEEWHMRANEGWHSDDINVVRSIHGQGRGVNEDAIGSMLEKKNEENVEMLEEEENVGEIWLERMREIVQDYDLKDIANVDKVGLFYSALPSDVSPEKDICASGKQSKDWLFIIVAVFANGRIEKPVVVGRSENPKCFVNLKKDQLPVTWKASEKCCVTSSIFEDFLNDLNYKMKTGNRKILLFLDNATYQAKIQLSNVQLVNFPPKLKPWLQPLNNGILKLFKMNYRELMLRKILVNKEVGKMFNERIDVLEAITLVNQSLKCIPEVYIQRCFKNCGLRMDVFEDFAELSVCKIGEIEKLIKELYEDGNVQLDAEDYVNFDEILNRKEEADLESMLTIKGNETDSGTQIEENKDCSGKEVPSSSQVLQSLMVLKNFAKMKGKNEFFDKVVELEFYVDKMKEFPKKNIVNLNA